MASTMMPSAMIIASPLHEWQNRGGSTVNLLKPHEATCIPCGCMYQTSSVQGPHSLSVGNLEALIFRCTIERVSFQVATTPINALAKSFLGNFLAGLQDTTGGHPLHRALSRRLHSRDMQRTARNLQLPYRAVRTSMDKVPDHPT